MEKAPDHLHDATAVKANLKLSANDDVLDVPVQPLNSHSEPGQLLRQSHSNPPHQVPTTINCLGAPGLVGYCRGIIRSYSGRF